MRPLIQEIPTCHTPESLVSSLIAQATPGDQRATAHLQPILLRSGLFDSAQARYSFVAARPFLTFRSFGSRCEISARGSRDNPEPGRDVFHRVPNLSEEIETRWNASLPDEAGSNVEAGQVQFGDPWRLLDSLMSRYELLDEVDLPFPLGGCCGYWGYGLKNFVEPKLPRGIADDLELPDCHVGFYDSLVVFDHWLGKTWIVATGLAADGSRNELRADAQAEFWAKVLEPCNPGILSNQSHETPPGLGVRQSSGSFTPWSKAPEDWRTPRRFATPEQPAATDIGAPMSSLSKSEFISRVQTAQRYIRAGDIYQVNLSQRFEAPYGGSGWELFEALSAVSPAPFAAYLDCGEFQIVSSSPEQFLRLSGSHIRTRPIKGTRPRSADPTRDAQLSYELQTSAKEMAELVMITDLLRNDLGRVCEFGSVQVPELARLEKYPQVQHLVSTVEGRLRRDVTHFAAFSSCFPGGSITGAPKFRAMQIIEELEPVARGPYTGALGYLGFNRESQLSIIIRTAVLKDGRAWFSSGAGIVADSAPEAEYEETLAKARGFFAAIKNKPAPRQTSTAERRASSRSHTRPLLPDNRR